ncbi:hypothetical protein EJ110_NYTH28923 [Nymphaea thermarum]|nr:hypothetical protein EJ110_NYTH28923 [Nymphaea thermarum]
MDEAAANGFGCCDRYANHCSFLQTLSPKRVTLIASVWFFLSICVVVQPYLAVLTSVFILFNGQLRRLLRVM